MAEYTTDAIYDTIILSRQIQPIEEKMGWAISDVIAKLFEEAGEFSEAVQIERGMINKKREYDAPFYEAADSMICIIDALSRLYPSRSPSQICTLLHHALRRKGGIWKNKMDAAQ